MVTGHRVLPRFAKLRPDSLVDRVLAKDLREIQINTHKQVKLTVVFWDISNFSNLCEDFVGYPGVLIDLLSKYFAKAIKIIKKHNGVLDKFMGDGILAYFGYNGKEEDGDPSNAIRAALEFKKQFPTLKTNFAQLCKEIDIKKRVRRFDLKCGIEYRICACSLL